MLSGILHSVDIAMLNGTCRLCTGYPFGPPHVLPVVCGRSDNPVKTTPSLVC